jgi:hypothetical protein
MSNVRYKVKSRMVRKHQSGQAAVEFLLTVILVMLLILAFVELIMMLFAYNVVADAAKEGVRFAIVHGTLSNSCNGPGDPLNGSLTCDASKAGVITAVTNYANHSGQTVAAGEIAITYTNPTGGAACSSPGCGIQITISHPYRAFFGLGWPSVRLAAAARGTVTF